MSKFKSFLLLISLSVFNFSGFAEKLTTDSLHAKKLNEVKVDGRAIRIHRSALPTQELNSKEIASLNATSVSDVSKYFAGVNVKDYGGIGGLKTVSIRGLGALHTGVSYDGVMMSDIQTGQIDLGKFSVENIADVSISNGQPNDFFQPARMFASSGVLSFNTLLPKYDSTNTFIGKATLKSGSFGLFNPTLYLLNHFNRKFTLSISSDGVLANGEYNYNEINNPGSVKRRVNSDVQSVRTELNAVYRIKDFESLTFKANHYFSERGLPGPNILYSTYSTDRMLDRNYLAQLKYENKQSCFFQYQLQGKANRATSRYRSYDLKYSGDHWLIDDYEQNEYYLSVAAQYFPIYNLAITGAVDGWYNDLFSHTTNLNYRKDATPVRKTLMANLAAKYTTDRVTLGANLLFTGTKEDAKENPAPDRSKFSPTVSATVKLLDDKELRLRLFYKNIFRLPTFTDLYYHDFGYSALRPELTDQYNIGLLYRETKISFLRSLDMSVDAYYNRVTDKITVKYGMPFSSVRNVGRVDVLGVDAHVGAVVPLGTNKSLIFRSNYTFQQAQDVTPDSPNYGEQIPYTPIHSGGASLSYQQKMWEAGYNILYSGIRWDGQNIKGNRLDAYAEQSVYAVCRLKQFNIKGEIINLFNQQYEVVKSYPMPGRNWRISLSYNF